MPTTGLFNHIIFVPMAGAQSVSVPLANKAAGSDGLAWPFPKFLQAHEPFHRGMSNANKLTPRRSG